MQNSPDSRDSLHAPNPQPYTAFHPKFHSSQYSVSYTSPCLILYNTCLSPQFFIHSVAYSLSCGNQRYAILKDAEYFLFSASGKFSALSCRTKAPRHTEYLRDRKLSQVCFFNSGTSDLISRYIRSDSGSAISRSPRTSRQVLSQLPSEVLLSPSWHHSSMLRYHLHGAA